MTPIQIIALIDAFVVLAEKLPTLVEALKRNTEMTPEEEAALDARIAGLKALPHWKRE
jgi:hypothetical protein